MTVENADNIEELVATLPADSDPVAEGADHMRLIKSVLKQVFQGNTGPGIFTQNWFLGVFGYAGAFGNFTSYLQAPEIRSCPQVSIAGATMDGSGNILGQAYGVLATEHVTDGVYDIQLEEQQWAVLVDLQAGGCVDYGLLGLGALALRDPQGAGHTIGQGWISIVTALIDDPAPDTEDPLNFQFFIFDSGRT
jgi:hypothetical protein